MPVELYLSILRGQVRLLSSFSIPCRLASHIHFARQDQADDLQFRIRLRSLACRSLKIRSNPNAHVTNIASKLISTACVLAPLPTRHPASLCQHDMLEICNCEDPETLQHFLMTPTCLPVQRGLGLMTAGMGTTPSQSSNHIRMFMKTSFSMKVSRFVISRQPNSVSCTMPITGLFAYIMDVLEDLAVSYLSFQLHPGLAARLLHERCYIK